MAEQYIDRESLKITRDKLWAISQEKGITLEEMKKEPGLVTARFTGLLGEPIIFL